jgi:hypothetical protein
VLVIGKVAFSEVIIDTGYDAQIERTIRILRPK